MDPEKLYALYKKYPDICTDTRTLRPGCLFFALEGPRFDGNRFAGEALRNGAAYAVVSDKNLSGPRFIHVKDPLEALQAIARIHRGNLDIPILAITGSNGKTTTKELVLSVLAGKFRVFGTKGNLNNHIGVPISILSIPAYATFGVIEMGANHEGEIKFLCEMARPTHGLVTNIGKAHLEGFGSLDGVIRAKSELYGYLAKHNGTAFVNLNEENLEKASGIVKDRFTYRFDDKPEIGNGMLSVALHSDGGSVLEFSPGDGKHYAVKNPLFGKFNAQNVLTAIAVGIYFNVPSIRIREAIEAFQPGINRSQWIGIGGAQIMLDAYNANPTSMRLAIDTFADMPFEKKILILGSMKELGQYAKREHHALVDYLKTKGNWEHVLLIGEEYEDPEISHWKIFSNVEEACTWLKQHPVANAQSGILIKGSRANTLERLVDFIRPSEPI